jgi:hypothetical protein
MLMAMLRSMPHHHALQQVGLHLQVHDVNEELCGAGSAAW